MQTDSRPIDLYGATHLGRVRRENQDHFLTCSLGEGLRVWGTSVESKPDGWTVAEGELPSSKDTLVAAVADGVGGGPGGERASRFAVVRLPEHLRTAMAPSVEYEAFNDRLVSAVLGLHADVNEHAQAVMGLRGMATTLTLWLGMDDQAFLVQVGDSRCYRLRDGELDQLSQDQTMAQDLVDRGVLESTEQAPAGWDNILTSALGGTAAIPVVVVTDRHPGDRTLVCSDGVMKHVPDDEIREILASDRSAQEMVDEFLLRALAGGGSDNITAVVIKEPV